jgi:hypothetical protein
MSMKNSNDTLWNRTGDLPIYSTFNHCATAVLVSFQCFALIYNIWAFEFHTHMPSLLIYCRHKKKLDHFVGKIYWFRINSKTVMLCSLCVVYPFLLLVYLNIIAFVRPWNIWAFLVLERDSPRKMTAFNRLTTSQSAHPWIGSLLPIEALLRFFERPGTSHA